MRPKTHFEEQSPGLHQTWRPEATGSGPMMDIIVLFLEGLMMMSLEISIRNSSINMNCKILLKIFDISSELVPAEIGPRNYLFKTGIHDVPYKLTYIISIQFGSTFISKRSSEFH